ncbi:MAG: alpha-amylase family glycosyl hydrolase, partial [Chitinophagales bacterium]
MKKILHTTFIFLFLQTANAQSEISGLASPIQLETDTTIVYLEDYFTDVSVIQKIETPDILKQELSADKKILKLTSIKNEIPFLSELKITTAINTYSILMRKSKKEKVTFAFDAQGKTYSKVSIVGDFTGWNPNVIFMENKKGIWQAELVLNPGRYQYQIVADGNWFLDPSNSEKIDNGIGGYNSLMKVGSLNKDVLPYYNCERITEDTIWINHYDPFDEFNSTLIFLWDNFIAENSIDGNGSYYVVIPGVSKNKKRSFIRLFSFNQFGESNDLLIPLEYGKVISDPSLLEKDDFQKTIMYFMMVDRFNNGDTANDNPVQDDRVLPQANYYGGDLTGILKKIDEGYFQSLGVNSLWISPVFQNPYNAYQEYPPPHRWFSGY